MKSEDSEVYRRLLVSYTSKKDELKIKNVASLSSQLYENEVSYEDIDFYSPGLRDREVSIRMKTFPFKTAPTPQPSVAHPHTPITKSIRPDRARLRPYCQPAGTEQGTGNRVL